MIHPLRDYLERRRVRTGPAGGSVEAPLRRGADARCTFRRAPGEEWAYDGQHVLLNGQPVDDFLTAEGGSIGVWCGLVDALGEYRDWMLEHATPGAARLGHVIGGLQERAILQLRRVYEEKIGGMAFTWGDGHLLLNNVNVRAILAMYHVRPTAKARRFLEGLRDKLVLILCDQPISPHAARVQHAAQGIYHDVCASLTTPPADVLCLPAGADRCAG